MDNSKEIIGLIPAAGRATRLGKLPCSKEVLPVNFTSDPHTEQPKVLADFILDAYQTAAINKAYFIIRKGKWDIPEYFGSGAERKMDLSYLITNLSYGIPSTLDQAYPFVKHHYVAMGFPDVVLRPQDTFLRLKEKIRKNHSTIVLGLFPNGKPEKNDMVELDAQGEIKSILIKPGHAKFKYYWAAAMWSPVFTEYMHQFLIKTLKKNKEGRIEYAPNCFREIYPGDIINGALQEGMKVDGVVFEEGSFQDLGTPDDLTNFLRS